MSVLVVVAIAVLVALPTALLFGLGDLVTDGAREGLLTVGIVLVLGASFFLLSVLWDVAKDRLKK